MRARFNKRYVRRAGCTAFAISCALTALGTRGVAARALPSQIVTHFAIADFDGDNRPDLASVHVGRRNERGTRYWIAFDLSGGSGQTVGITAPVGGVQIASRDVNGDTFPDVVITTVWTNQPVAVLLNDGFGNFTPSSPSEFLRAFTVSEALWTFAGDEIRDPAALQVSRCIFGDCAAKHRSWPLAGARRLLAAASGTASFWPSILPFIGRAPPEIKI